jgi:thioredoxin reductase/NAD-dependent dihydropyrimidine dehydrogenase PreA subunit
VRKIALAKVDGSYEPVAIHPVIDPDRCIKSGACITACPEKDIIGIRNGKATVINASMCIGHGACFRACPVEAINLCIGTKKRGVDIPELNDTFETNVPGIYVAGELGGMGLIKNAVTQGREAVENIVKSLNKEVEADYDLIVVGAGPAGISATLAAKKFNLKVLTLEQNTLGGTVYTFPRNKIVMTSPMTLPLYGKVKFIETTKTELLNLWKTVLTKNKITILENTKVEGIVSEHGVFRLETSNGGRYCTRTILLAIGRRGTPRRLNVPGEDTEKVSYQLTDDHEIKGKDIFIVGGGDSAIEAALSLVRLNKVTISYRGEKFSRLKVKNNESINTAIQNGQIDVLFNTNVVSIEKESIQYKNSKTAETKKTGNDLVFVFAGGELPTKFLQRTGINIRTMHGEIVLKHK